MFKGIHNEAEFYTNFYFDNKLSSDLQSKVATFADIKDKTDKLRGLESFYWAYRDAKPSNESLLEFYQKLLTVLGYQFDLKVVDTLKETSFNSIAQVHSDERTNLYVFLTNEIEEGTFETAPLALNIAENPETRELSEVISEFFDELENPPKWILVGSPTTMFLLERNKWAFGKYIKFNWDEIFQQRTDDLFSSILGLISKESLCPASGQSIHAEMDDNSHRHAFEVTTELRESVRESIELLINEMINQRSAKEKKNEKELLKGIDSTQYAKELSHDALFYAYRLIFLLFLEAQAEDSELLPLKSEIYRHGYSLEKLLELIHDIPDEKTADYEGTFVFESLQQIFSLIYNGFDYKVERDLLTDAAITNSGFLLKGIKSDLFSPEAVKHLKDIKLRNGVMLTVLRKLSLSSTGKGKNKRLTRVSYSNLGINQLGAVYEGLLSYSGFFAQEDLHALKPASVKQSDIDNGKELDQIYLAPKTIVDKYSSPKEKKYKLSTENCVLDDNGNPKIYKKGSFVYRLAGRDRQKLASFYTPESLTKCTVKYSLKVLFENKKTLADLWDVKILEPAMGSGAFLNEAVNQLADKILELEIQEKVKDLKTPKDKQKRLWEIKYELISKNVYGVDLNPTAIELARFSLWLNCIGAGKEPPHFDGRLKIGNSLIGVRNNKGVDGIYPWLLLEDGMMNYGKRLKDYDAEQFEKIQSFRKIFLNSKLDSSHALIRSAQLKAESVLAELINSKANDKKQDAYERLKQCADLWCSAFFLMVDDLKYFPSTHEKLCETFIAILEKGEMETKLQSIVEAKCNAERFFHWELEYHEVIAKNGFDLILGNPPWVAIEWEDSLYCSDENIIPALLNLKAEETRKFIFDNLSADRLSNIGRNYVSISGYSNFLENSFNIPLKGITKNTYKSFVYLSLTLGNEGSSIGLIHEDGILKEKKAVKLRRLVYTRYRYHLHFINSNLLFAEVDPKRHYSINIYSGQSSRHVRFVHVNNLVGTGDLDSKVLNEDARPMYVDDDFLEICDSFGSDSDLSEAPPLLSVNSPTAVTSLRKLSKSMTIKEFLKDDGFEKSQMINSVTHLGKLVEKKSFRPSSIEEMIFERIHFNSFDINYKEYSDDGDIVLLDKSRINRSHFSSCSYQLIDRHLAQEGFPCLKGMAYNKFFKVAAKRQMQFSDARCVFSAILPAGSWHLNSIVSIISPNLKKMPVVSGYCGSIVFEAITRIKSREDIYPDDLLDGVVGDEVFFGSIARRVLLLNCYPSTFEQLINANSDLFNVKDSSPLVDGLVLSSNANLEQWRDEAIREIDALVAISLNLTHDELMTLVKENFSALIKQDDRRSIPRADDYKRAMTYFQKRGW
jgi:hypothetical protein